MSAAERQTKNKSNNNRKRTKQYTIGNQSKNNSADRGQNQPMQKELNGEPNRKQRNRSNRNRKKKYNKVETVISSPKTAAELKKYNERLEKEILLDINSISQIEID